MKRNKIREVVAPACRDFHGKRLDLVGSVAWGCASEASARDLLVEFHEPADQPARQSCGLLHWIENTLGCEVDLLTFRSLRNHYFRKRVQEERVTLYEE